MSQKRGEGPDSAYRGNSTKSSCCPGISHHERRQRGTEVLAETPRGTATLEQLGLSTLALAKRIATLPINRRPLLAVPVFGPHLSEFPLDSSVRFSARLTARASPSRPYTMSSSGLQPLAPLSENPKLHPGPGSSNATAPGHNSRRASHSSSGRPDPLGSISHASVSSVMSPRRWSGVTGSR